MLKPPVGRLGLLCEFGPKGVSGLALVNWYFADLRCSWYKQPGDEIQEDVPSSTPEGAIECSTMRREEHDSHKYIYLSFH